MERSSVFSAESMKWKDNYVPARLGALNAIPSIKVKSLEREREKNFHENTLYVEQWLLSVSTGKLQPVRTDRALDTKFQAFFYFVFFF